MEEDSHFFWSFAVPSYKQYPEEETVDEIDVHADQWLKAYLAVTVIVCLVGLPANFLILYLIAKRKLYRDIVWLLHSAFTITLIVRIIMVPIEYHASSHPNGFAYETMGSCKAFHFFIEYSSASSNLMLLSLVFMRLVSFTPLCQYIMKYSTVCGTLVCIIVLSVSFFSTVPIVSYLTLYNFDTSDKVLRFCNPDYDKHTAYIRWNKFNVGCTVYIPFIIGATCVIIMAVNQDNFYRKHCKTAVSYLRQVDGLEGSTKEIENGGSLTKSDEFMEDRPMVEGIYSERSEEEERRITIMHITFMVIYMLILLPFAIVMTMALHHTNAYTSDLHWAIKGTHMVSVTVGMIHPLASFFIIPQFRRF